MYYLLNSTTLEFVAVGDLIPGLLFYPSRSLKYSFADS